MFVWQGFSAHQHLPGAGALHGAAHNNAAGAPGPGQCHPQQGGRAEHAARHGQL